jgi:16S rRNA G1207 methylase RsmC
VLEPSAGIGNIADKVREVTKDIDVIELMSSFREILNLKGYNLIGSDFMEYDIDRRYDAVIMNPPFSNNKDIEHLKHAYGFVKAGGVLVSITSPHWTFAGDKKSKEFREWIETQNYFSEPLESGTFEATGVRSEIVVIHKAS